MNRDTIRFKGKETKPNATYEVYSADTAEDAKAFLETKTVNQGKYYILVGTPEGVWGTDVHGLYLERLLPFQTRIETANCEGHICLTPAAKNVEMAARGLVESFVAGIKCGACSHEWKDALRYQKDTVVRCPKCKGLNKVGSGNVRVLFVRERAVIPFLKLSCTKCGTLYSIGEDAIIVTMDMTKALLDEAIILKSTEPSADARKDLVTPLSGVPADRRAPILLEAVETARSVLTSLKNGQKRRWICFQCKALNDYPSGNEPVIDDTSKDDQTQPAPAKDNLHKDVAESYIAEEATAPVPSRQSSGMPPTSSLPLTRHEAILGVIFLSVSSSVKENQESFKIVGMIADSEYERNSSVWGIAPSSSAKEMFLASAIDKISTPDFFANVRKALSSDDIRSLLLGCTFHLVAANGALYSRTNDRPSFTTSIGAITTNAALLGEWLGLDKQATADFLDDKIKANLLPRIIPIWFRDE